VDGALAAHALEQLQRRPVHPVLALQQERVLDVALSGSDLGLVRHARAYYWLAGQSGAQPDCDPVEIRG
jgi:hypothetical protein